MPRRAPDGQGVTEHRITFGNYERAFVTEIKTDLEKGVKIAAVSAVAIPVVVGASAVAGLGLLGYGIYCGLNTFGLMDIENPIPSIDDLKNDDDSYMGFILRGFKSKKRWKGEQIYKQENGGGGGDF